IESSKERLSGGRQQINRRDEAPPRQLNRRLRQIAADPSSAIFRGDRNRSQERTAFVHLERRTADDAVASSCNEATFEMPAQPIQRQVFALEQRYNDLVIRPARWSDGDDRHWSFEASRAQHGRSLARAAAGTQQPVCLSRRSASFLSASTCPSTCVVASSIVATIGSADFESV